ncbi:MAG: hypothetical protein IJX25_00180 [Clostridia bacterium]|nr:hypothetical protein [Clostridia bacterium]
MIKNNKHNGYNNAILKMETAVEYQNRNTELEKDIEELKLTNMNLFEYSQKVEIQLIKKEKEIQILNARLKARIFRIDKKEKIDLLKEVLDYFCEEEIDGDGIPTGDWVITKDAGAVAEFIDSLIKKLEGK